MGGYDVKGLDRTHVEDEGECDLGTAFGAGCYLHLCAVCGKTRDHLAFTEF